MVVEHYHIKRTIPCPTCGSPLYDKVPTCECGELICSKEIPVKRGNIQTGAFDVAIWYCNLTKDHVGLCNNNKLKPSQMFW